MIYARLRETVTLSGTGVHSGEIATIEIRPGAVGAGLTIQASPQGAVVPLTLDRVSATMLATTIAVGDERVMTVEHLVSALYGLGIFDAEIAFLSGFETPILDGSALPFVEVLVPLMEMVEGPREVWRVNQAFAFSDDGKHFRVTPAPTTSWQVTIDFAHPAIGRQSVAWEADPMSYRQDIAPARTFGFLRDLAPLREAGLALGATLESGVVYDEVSVVNGPLRFPNEAARHKTLDAIGDFALLGAPLLGQIELERGGHGFHVAAARALLASGAILRETR